MIYSILLLFSLEKSQKIYNLVSCIILFALWFFSFLFTYIFMLFSVFFSSAFLLFSISLLNLVFVYYKCTGYIYCIIIYRISFIFTSSWFVFLSYLLSHCIFLIQLISIYIFHSCINHITKLHPFFFFTNLSKRIYIYYRILES